MYGRMRRPACAIRLLRNISFYPEFRDWFLARRGGATGSAGIFARETNALKCSHVFRGQRMPALPVKADLLPNFKRPPILTISKMRLGGRLAAAVWRGACLAGRLSSDFLRLSGWFSSGFSLAPAVFALLRPPHSRAPPSRFSRLVFSCCLPRLDRLPAHAGACRSCHIRHQFICPAGA